MRFCAAWIHRPQTALFLFVREMIPPIYFHDGMDFVGLEAVRAKIPPEASERLIQPEKKD